MDKQELIMTIARDLLVEAIRKDQIPVDLTGSGDKSRIAAAAYSNAMANLISGLEKIYDAID